MSSDAAALLPKLLGQLDHAVLRRVDRAKGSGPDRGFELAADAPEWFADVFGNAAEAAERSDFLGDFIGHLATGHWAGKSADPLPSGVWQESGGRYFEASAWNLDGEHLLLITAADESVGREQRFVQSNHEQVLERRRILKEIEKKEILLDCIVHDLSGPVSTLLMNLEYIERELDETSALQPAVHRALNQTQRQLTMIRSISHLFASDIEAAESDDGTQHGVDIIAAAHEIVDLHRSAAGDIRVRVRVIPEESGGALHVAGREPHISRIIENLLLNAIRHTPADGQIMVSVEALDKGDQIEVRVEDNGPGVEPGLAGELFRPFTQGRDHPGQSGLGLYFCRIVVEQNGGSIGYHDGDQGGARFWFRLPAARHAGNLRGS